MFRPGWFPAFLFRLLQCSLAFSVLLLAGCLSILDPLTVDISYLPPPAKSQGGKPVFLHLEDERRSDALSSGAGFSVPVLNKVHVAIPGSAPGSAYDKTAPADAPDTFFTPAKAAHLALAARLESMGHPVLTRPEEALHNAHRLVLYVYSFEVSFSEQAYSSATVGLALGKIPGDVYLLDKPVTPERPLDAKDGIHAPICTQSVGLGTAPTVGEARKESADISLSRALERAVNALDIKRCLP